jgi:hypothetical protein
MRRLLFVSALIFTLALELATGGSQFGSYFVEIGGHAHLLASGVIADGWPCGGTVGTPC